MNPAPPVTSEVGTLTKTIAVPTGFQRGDGQWAEKPGVSSSLPKCSSLETSGPGLPRLL
jgi:hypothetical protein